jgi:hypothetical protein
MQQVGIPRYGPLEVLCVQEVAEPPRGRLLMFGGARMSPGPRQHVLAAAWQPLRMPWARVNRS